MTELPEPMTPAGCNLQDFKFMPLDVARLRGSELASDETPEACWAAVLLWCASWHEIPAGSIPDNDQWQAKHAGYVARGKIAKEWIDVRSGALRGWIKCSDGRLYHPVVVEKAIEAWESKLDQRWRSEVGRIKKHNERHHMSLPRPSFDEWVSLGCPQGHRLPVPNDNTQLSTGQAGGVPSETGSKGQGEGQGQGQGQGQLSSVPDGTGGKPPKTPAEMAKAELWKAGKSLLRDQGMPEKQCGTFVGKLCKDYGDEIVIEAVRNTVVKQAADSATFLKAECQRLAGERKTTKTTATDRRVETMQGLAATSPNHGEAHDAYRTVDAESRILN